MIFGVNDGHTLTGPGSGAIGIINESDQTRAVGAKVRDKFNVRGATAINCTVDSADTQLHALQQITAQANRQDLDWFIAIHFNAGGGRGVEAYTYEGRQYEDAINVVKNISALGFNNRGIKSGNGLYVIGHTKAKAILIEVCFVDTEDANHYLEVGADAIADAIVNAYLPYVAPQPLPVIEQPVQLPTPVPQPAAEPPKPIDPEILRRQQLLNRMGIRDNDGRALVEDGINGPRTESAYAKLPVIKEHDRGEAVRVIQEIVGCGNDGIFGPTTKKFVKSYQRRNGLVSDGVVGPRTWHAMM